MPRGRYNFDLLYRHSNELAINTRRSLKKEINHVKDNFRFLEQHFDRFERQQKSHYRNVKMGLNVRFINHLFSYELLVERCLLLDAANCARNATEALAFYWLVCKAASAAELYDAQDSPRAVDLRERLEPLGVDVSELREQYGFESAVSHVGNKYDNLQINREQEQSGALLIGGGGNANVQRDFLRALPKYIFQFVTLDSEYIVTTDDGDFSVTDRSDPNIE